MSPKRGVTAAGIARKKKEGRGQGQRRQYKPYLTVGEFGSLGNSHRVYGLTTERRYELLSDGEFLSFCLYDWSQRYSDIQEQFKPMDIGDAQKIAERAGIRYPVDPQTKHPNPITVDFVLTRNIAGREIKIARSYKNSIDVRSTRTLEKLDLERLVCWAIGIDDWAITTERQFPQPLTENLSQIYCFSDYTLENADLTLDQFMAVVEFMTPRVQERTRALVEITTEADKRLGNEPGTAFPIAWHLVARRRWIVDMDMALRPNGILPLMRVNLDGFVPL